MLSPRPGRFSGEFMNIKIATPYSHLFACAEAKRRVIELSDMAEIRGPDQLLDITPNVLWHCDLSLVRPWADKHLAYLLSIVEGFRSANVKLNVASFHAPSRYQANDVAEGAFVGRGHAMAEEDMLINAQTNAATIRDMLNNSGYSNVKLLLENNNHLGTDAYEVVTCPNFITRLLDHIDFELLFDVAHARITAVNTGVDEQKYLEMLPLERAVQIHLSRHTLRDGRALDAHDALADEDWQFFHSLMPQLPKLGYATVEYYKDVDVLLGLLKRLRKELEACKEGSGETIQ
jgi:uncharacterized protein